MTAKVVEIAVIVPVFDDAAALRALLTRIRAWDVQPMEILVVAGAASPEIESVCRGHGTSLEWSKPCRGYQLDNGAHAALADILWFLHADALPTAASLDAIATARAAGAESGVFRFEFAGAPTLRKRAIAAGVALRVRWGGIPYGDQGLWTTRAAYSACGGFLHEPLFEEVRLVKRLRKRRTFVALDEPIGVSPRRWERDGWARRCAANRLLAAGHLLGVSPARLAASYDRASPVENSQQ